MGLLTESDVGLVALGWFPALSDECSTLAATRDVLLPKLLSGEVRAARSEKSREDGD